ncbi:hypothetical protein Franean1_6266 [Parafrankia sp. EAN1pec]|uniref:hypothetical protein n=1 Tax=Parafrankia sp. (strain EAN1pec) TaxID=298653 RepID=UPI0000540375|nr:hypothetical protein Franean1_6266 [Frankia sp. EAN1pec]
MNPSVTLDPTSATEQLEPAVVVQQVALTGMTHGALYLGTNEGATVADIIAGLQQLPPDAVLTSELLGSHATLSLIFTAPEDLDQTLATHNQPGHEYIHEAIGAYRARKAAAARWTDGAR